jgi:ABC-2 type transport system ATP-binding protein
VNGDPEVRRRPAIETRDVAKQYGSVRALRDLSLTVERGEIFGFLGPNGAGKTTAVKILLGLTRASAGRGAILGRPLGALEARKRIGYLPELFRYQEWLTAPEVLDFHAALLGLPARARKAEIARVLDVVGLAGRERAIVGTFSKGMQQRLGLGVALVGEPELLILDEPTSALDPVGRADVRTIVREARSRGATVFLNSHLLAEVEAVCDRLAILDKGSVVASGTMAEILGAFSVRITFAEVPLDGAWDALHAHTAERIGERVFLLRAIAEAEVPALVAALVRCGSRVAAVEPVRGSLEERFLKLIGAGNADAAGR